MSFESLADGVDTRTAVVLALISTLTLAALHLAAPRIRHLPGVPEKATVSFGAGIAVTYVFLHLLPEVAAAHSELRELLGEDEAPSLLMELGVFLVALLGFLLFYGLERAAIKTRSTGDTGANRGVYRLHLASFVVYNAIITYTMPLTYRTGVVFAVMFTIAMGLHFVLSDRSLEEHYGQWFDRWLPRLVLVGALVLGWVLAVLFAPTKPITVSLLTAFLAGSILLNVFKSELPSAKQSSFGWFMVGTVLYAGVLVGVTVAAS